MSASLTRAGNVRVPTQRARPTAGWVRVWRVGSLEADLDFLAHDHAVTALEFSRDGRTLVTGDARGNIRVWDISDLR